jgi:hypothetical protein
MITSSTTPEAAAYEKTASLGVAELVIKGLPLKV